MEITKSKWFLPALAALIIVAVFIALLFAFTDPNSGANNAMESSSSQSSDAMMDDKDKMMDDSSSSATSSMMDDDKMEESKGPGAYVTYSSERLAAAHARGDDVVLFFHATWCTSCQAHDKNINAAKAKIPANVTILKTDYDDYTALKQKYGVTLQHTFVQVDKDGKQLKKWNSYYGDSSLQGILDQII